MHTPENLNTLEEYANSLFGQIRNTEEFRLTSIIPEFKHVYKIKCSVPHRAYQLYYTIRIVFPTCKKVIDSKNTAVSRFISYLFEYDGKGSLISVLRAKKWATSVEAGELACPNGFGFFVVAINLTKIGYQQYFDEIMGLFVQYVRILHETSDSDFRRIYNEYKEIMELKFRFKKKEFPLAVVCNRVRHINIENTLNDILRDDTIPPLGAQYCVRHTFRQMLQPSLNLRIYLNHPFSLNNDAKLKRYGRIPCKIELVSLENCSKWMRSQFGELNAPVPNKFIPLKCFLKPCEPKEPNIPIPIHDTKFIRTWYKRDNIFHEPRGSAYFHFVCPETCESDFNAHLTSLYVDVLNVYLKDYKYPAGLVDLRWELSATIRGIMIKINGFDDTLHVLLEEIIKCIIMPQNTMQNLKAIFEVFAYRNPKQCKRNIRRFNELPPYERAVRYLPYLLTERLWTPQQVWKNSERVTWKEFNAFLERATESFHMECLFHGNITRAEATKMTDAIEKIIRCKSKSQLITPILKEDHQLYREVRFEQKEYNHYVIQEECSHTSSCMLQFCQIDVRSKTLNVLLDIAQMAIRDLLARKLKNSGVKIFCGRHRGNVMQGLTFLFQGQNKQFYEFIKNGDFNKILKDMQEVINISVEKFERIKSCVAVTRRKPETLYELSDTYWNEILAQRYNFDWRSDEMKYLDELTKDEFCEFYQEHISSIAPALSVYAISQDLPIKEALMHNVSSRSYIKEVTMIDDIASFMNNRKFYKNDYNMTEISEKIY